MFKSPMDFEFFHIFQSRALGSIPSWGTRIPQAVGVWPKIIFLKTTCIYDL